MSFVAATALGFVVAEVVVYCWHRWVSHAGILRSVANDIFRRRHFHHHCEQYPPQRLHARVYIASCDVTFGTVEVLLLLGAAALAAMRAVSLPIMAAAVAGILLHGWLAAKLHKICHASDSEVPRPLRRGPIRRALLWLQKFHDAHHTGRGNYSLLLPVVDLIGGTLVRQPVAIDEIPGKLFPQFSSDLSSSCEDSLL